jgi:hypothetical protein
MLRIFVTTAALSLLAPAAVMSAAHSEMSSMVMTSDQSVANGIVSAKEVIAPENGWMVVHRTDATKKPGYVVGHAPLRKGQNKDVAAILTEKINPGEMLMLMVHSEDGGNFTGIFEYTLGAKEDGPIKPDGKLVMKVITAQ